MSRHRPFAILGMVLALAMVLSGCGPQTEATPPPATVIGPDAGAPTETLPSNPAPVPATLVTAPTAQIVEPTAYVPPMPPGFKEGDQGSVPTVVYPDALEGNGASGPGFSLTILHTNDVQGELDPCG